MTIVINKIKKTLLKNTYRSKFKIEMLMKTSPFNYDAIKCVCVMLHFRFRSVDVRYSYSTVLQ